MGNPATSKQPQKPLLTAGVATKEGPCPVPAGCENKSPEKHEEWGKHELPIKKWCYLDDHIEELLNSEFAQITLRIRQRIDLPPSLASYEIGDFQVIFQGYKESTKTIARNWLFKRWKHKRALEKTNLPPEEQESYYGRTNKTDKWEGNDLTKKFEASAPPVETDSEKVYVNEVVMQKGLDYTINYSTGEITFNTAPKLLSKIEATYTGYGEREPGHPTEGAILEEYDESTGDFEEVTEKNFEQSREEAHHYYDLFIEVVKDAYREKYEESIKTKMEEFEEIADWIENWAVPFPSRRLTPAELRKVEGPIELGLECPECNTEWRLRHHEPRAEPLSMRFRKTECPNTKCKKTVTPKVTKNLSWDEKKLIFASLEVDVELENRINRKKDEKYVVSPLVVFFKLDMPKSGQTATTTEKEALEDPSQLNQVAKELAKHYCALEICGFELRLIVRGYADSSASCRYNVELSKRRVQWVVDTLKNNYGLKLDPKSVQPIACGKSFADEKRAVSERFKDRVLIIELNAVEVPSEKKEKPKRFSIIEKVEQEQKRQEAEQRK